MKYIIIFIALALLGIVIAFKYFPKIAHSQAMFWVIIGVGLLIAITLISAFILDLPTLFKH